MEEKKLSVFFFLLVGLCVAALMVLLLSIQLRASDWVDKKIYDTYLRLSKTTAASEEIVIVDIDEKSLNLLGQWPWPRHIMSLLFANLSGYGAASIGVDIMFSESDRSSPKLMKDNLKRFYDIDIDFKNLPKDFYDNDKTFAETLDGTPSVLGMYINFDNGTKSINGVPNEMKVSFVSSANAKPIESVLRGYIGNSVTAPLEIFYSVASVGFFNAISDIDGIMRKAPLIMGVYDNESIKYYPSLSLQVLITAYDVKNVIAKIDEDGLSSLRVGPLLIPTSSDGNFYVKFKGTAKTYKYISASDVIFGKIDPKEIEAKIVLIGTSTAGLQDIRSTPFDNHFPGVEVHANIIDNIMSEEFISIPSGSLGIQALIIVILGIAIALLFRGVSTYFSLPFAGALVVLAWILGQYFFNKGQFISPLYIILTIIMEAGFVLMIQYIFESSQKRKIKGAFGRYVSPVVVNQIANSGIDVFKGTEREVTAMFTDIRGFTSISEKLGPEKIVELLNRYFTPMTSLIKNSGGTLDKFIGDAIVAFWNAPLDVENHQKKAIQVGIDMQVELKKLNVLLEADYGISLGMGAGVNTGNVYVGNMGSKDLLDYTIIGDNVNLTSRLEGLCSKYGVTLVVSENTMAACIDDYYYQVIDRIKVKGKTKPVSVYFPMSHDDALIRAEELRLYEKAHEDYVSGRFIEAHSAFNILTEKYKGGIAYKLYSVYLERCVELIELKPENWEGIWEYTSK